MLKPYFKRNSQVKTHLVNAVSLHPREENADTPNLTLSRVFMRISHISANQWPGNKKRQQFQNGGRHRNRIK